MPKGVIDALTTNYVRGDLLTIFKPLDETLSNYNSKLSIPLNLFNRANRRASYALLEVLVESKGGYSEWKLKMNGINITRLFKPSYALGDLEKGRGFYKFVYDITSILNTGEAINKEWINLGVKYEGGDPFTIKAILLDVIYEDQDALTYYKHLTGLLLFRRGESVKFSIDSPEKVLTARLVAYVPKPAELRISTSTSNTKYSIPQRRFEELILTLSNNEEYIEIVPAQLDGGDSYILLSNITLYNSIVKQPLLEFENISYAIENNKFKLKLAIRNKGEVPPDKIVISLLRRGYLLYTLQKSEPKIPPGELLETDIELPMSGGLPEDLYIRLIWMKLTRRWVHDRAVKIVQ